MQPNGTATMTAAEFDQRVKAANAYVNRALVWFWTPAGIAFVLMIAWLAIGEDRVPEWLGNGTVLTMLFFSLAGIIAGVVREARATRMMGLECAGCGNALPGGKLNEITKDVRETGCCHWCRAPVLSDHPGAMEAMAREAGAAPGTPHASAFEREDFARLWARYKAQARRRITLVIAVGLGAMPLLLLIMLLPLPLEHRTKWMILNAVMLIEGVVIVWAMLGGKSAWRRIGLECPACRQLPTKDGDISVVRTGVCAHCTTLIVRPAA